MKLCRCFYSVLFSICYLCVHSTNSHRHRNRRNHSEIICRVTIDASANYVMRGGNLKLSCHYNCKTCDIAWYKSGNHKILPHDGLIHITEVIKHHTKSVVSELEIFKVKSKDGGIYMCETEGSNFNTEVTVIDIHKESHMASTGQQNLSCEIMGFGHNLPEIRLYWLLPNGFMLNKSALPKFEFGCSSESLWLSLDSYENPGNYSCIFELSTVKGSFTASTSFYLQRKHRMIDIDRPSSAEEHLSISTLVGVISLYTWIWLSQESGVG